MWLQHSSRLSVQQSFVFFVGVVGGMCTGPTLARLASSDDDAAAAAAAAAAVAPAAAVAAAVAPAAAAVAPVVPATLKQSVPSQ